MTGPGHLRRFGQSSAISRLPLTADIRTNAGFRRYGPPPGISLAAQRRRSPDSRPNFYCADYSSDRGRYQTNPHISGNVDACVIGEHAAVRNSENQFAAPHLAHINLIAYAFDFWRDMPSEL